MLAVFNNALEFNNKEDALTSRCRVLVQYVKWLSLETLPLQSDENAVNPEALGALRTSVRDQERAKRMDIIKSAPLDTRAAQKLIKVFEQRKNRKEYEYFSRCVIIRMLITFPTFVRYRYADDASYCMKLEILFRIVRTYMKYKNIDTSKSNDLRDVVGQLT